MPKITPTHWTILEKIFLLAYTAISVSIIRNNMRTANMSRERYFELLSQV